MKLFSTCMSLLTTALELYEAQKEKKLYIMMNFFHCVSDRLYLDFYVSSFCSMFSLFLQVNQKMILILTASIMYWSLQKKSGESESTPTEDSGKPGGSIADSADGESQSASSPSTLSQQTMDIENEEASF